MCGKSPCAWVSRVWPDEKVVFLVGNKVHTSHVHGLVAAIEANVAFFGLAGVTRRSNDQTLNIIEDSLVLRVRVGHVGFLWPLLDGLCALVASDAGQR